jgi:hypothetical protein
MEALFELDGQNLGWMAARNIHGQQVQEQGTWENNTFA